MVQHDTERSGSTFPFGAHVAVVEVDTETGRVTPRQHFAVDDCGVIVNPLLVDGQVHGGLASGIGQALWEQMVYDDDGNPLTSTLAEYAIPSAAELPSYVTSHPETPSPLNELGAKGIGESATVGSTPAVQNAVVDALSHLGVRHVDMPCTSERVWRAIQDAKSGNARRPVARAAGRDGVAAGRRRRRGSPRARSRGDQPVSERRKERSDAKATTTGAAGATTTSAARSTSSPTTS